MLVSKKKYSTLFFLFLFLFFFFLINVSFSQTPGQWTWMHGDNTTNQTAVFGTQGISSSANKPGGLYEAVQWTDLNGNFWLFGGHGYPSGNDQSDLWKYDPSSNQWTWVKGPGVGNQSGSYGTKGSASSSNNPGARGWGAASWTDIAGNLWLFGGSGFDASGNYGVLNDLWKYDIGSNEWTWMNGSDLIIQSGIYGTKGISSASNTPGARQETNATWTDNSGNLWLFGGVGFVPSYTVVGMLNDLWKYNLGTNEWAWMNGSNLINQQGAYGTKGIANAGNIPGGRYVYSKWKDKSGNFWLFGGSGFVPSYSVAGGLNDLWKYDLNTGQWTWVSGTDTLNSKGNYGTKCTASVNNIPQARIENRACWTDSCGNFWTFGGGLGGGTFNISTWNDLWCYHPKINEWIWVSGNGNSSGGYGVYGTKGISAASNTPGGRGGSISWMDKKGYLFLFGGVQTGNFDYYYNDLWRFVPDTNCTGGINSCNNNAPCNISVQIVSSVSLTCNGVCTGQSTASVSAGTAPYNFLWNNGASTNSTTGLCAGNYSLLVTDNAGCTGAATVFINQPSLISTTITATPATCGNADGAVVVTNSGGTPGYMYEWNNGVTSSKVSSLQVGSYTVTVTDANGCTDIRSITVNNQNGVTAQIISSADVMCNGASTGSATVGGTGGTLPYSYLWSNGVTQASVISLQASVYSITVTDANGCSSSASVTINQPTALTLTISATDATCGASTGSASLIISGGTNPYSYLWNIGATVSHISNLISQIYSVTVTDANGCTNQQSAIINQPSTPTVSISANVTITLGESTTLSAYALGLAPYAYLWNPSTGLSCSTCQYPIASPQQNIIYCVTISDANGCSDSSCVSIGVILDSVCGDIFVPTAFSPNADNENDELCLYGANCVSSLEFIIYNRWGEKVFSTNDIAQCWNGIYKNKDMDTGIFVYYLYSKNSAGEEKIVKGNITLVR